MTNEELKQILRLHQLWLNNEPGGVRADLSGADLKKADLRKVNLEGAVLKDADLSEADLSEANLVGADLTGANLTGADLISAELRRTDFSNAVLRNADLRNAYFPRADLKKADLTGADLRYAELRNADLAEAKIDFQMACPASGSYIAYKAVPNYIVKLEIPEDASRSSGTTNKCRASKAKVLAIENPDGTDSGVHSCFSHYDQTFIYTVGETVSVDYFDLCRWNECSTGIHHFIKREEALKYFDRMYFAFTAHVHINNESR